MAWPHPNLWHVLPGSCLAWARPWDPRGNLPLSPFIRVSPLLHDASAMVLHFCCFSDVVKDTLELPSPSEERKNNDAPSHVLHLLGKSSKSLVMRRQRS